MKQIHLQNLLLGENWIIRIYLMGKINTVFSFNNHSHKLFKSLVSNSSKMLLYAPLSKKKKNLK